MKNKMSIEILLNIRGTTWYVLYLLLLTRFNNGGETCPFCGKNFNTLGRHIWRCTANSHKSLSSS